MLIFESTFPKDYRKEEIKQILGLTTTGKFCQVVAIPGSGKATLLRLLAHNREILKYHLGEKEKNARFEYINLLELTEYADAHLFKFILLSLGQEVPSSDDSHTIAKKIQESINSLSQKGQTTTLLFDHFDEYQNQLPRAFFQLLRDLASVAKYKFSAVFATRRDLKDLVDPEILKHYWEFFIGNAIYLEIGNKQATEILYSQIEEVLHQKLSPETRSQITSLAGGHTKLTKVVSEQVLREKTEPEIQKLTNMPLVQATLFELWFYLTAQEQQTLRLLAKGLPAGDLQVLEDLVKSNLIQVKNAPQQSNNLIFTIPIFEEFIKTTIPSLIPEKIIYEPDTKEIKKGENVISDLLSPQEYRLLKFLVENQGEVITRDEIIRAVWPEAQVAEGISDEAIDQMVFRLRKKIEDEPNSPKHITTVKGQGWRFSP